MTGGIVNPCDHAALGEAPSQPRDPPGDAAEASSHTVGPGVARADRRQPPGLRVAPSENMGKEQAAQSYDVEETEPTRTGGPEEAPVRGGPSPSGHLSGEAPSLRTCSRPTPGTCEVTNGCRSKLLLLW